MNTEFNNIKERFLNAGIVEQLIYVNAIIFLVSFVFGIFRSTFFYDLFALPASLNVFIKKPWTILSYGFLHAGFIHVLSNLIGLFYLGNLFLEYFSRKDVLNFYLLGTLIGGIFFLIGGTFIPALQYSGQQLVGASAGVSAIFIGIATHIPNYQLRFRLIGYIKLWHIAIFWLAFNFLFILVNNNIGGSLAHLGGALFGFIYVSMLYKQKNGLKKYVVNNKTPFKNVYKTKRQTANQSSKGSHQQKIDTILDKISKSGYDSLSKSEKEFLFKQGKQ